MPSYLSPGVYIEEQDTGPEPIEGVSTSVTGFVGVTQMGPLDTNPPVLVTSFPDFARTFGSYFTPAFNASSAPSPLPPWGYNLLPHAVAGFFNNGGELLYIKRIAAQKAGSTTIGNYTAVSANITGLANNLAKQIVTTLAQTVTPGAASILYLQSLRGIQQNSVLTLTQVMNGITTQASGVAIASVNDGTGSVTLTAAGAALITSTYNAQYTTVSVTGNPAFNLVAIPLPTASTSFALSAANQGAWGNGVQIQIQPSSRAVSQLASNTIVQSTPGTFDTVLLNSTANFYPGAIVEFNLGTSKCYAKVLNVIGNSIQISGTSIEGTIAAAFPSATALGSGVTTARTCEFSIFATYGNVSESWTGLTLDYTTPFYYATTINNGSTLLSVPELTTPINPLQPYPSDEKTPDPGTMPMGVNLTMTNGQDGNYPLPSDYIGSDGGPGHRTGIQALIDADEISIIGTPAVTDPSTQQALITQCEILKYRFAILDPNPSATNGTALTNIQNQRLQFDTEYAAIYYPSLIVTDPLTGNNLTVPPSGHMAGIYAQTDDSRGVWKAPANVVINGINLLEVKVNKAEQDILNPEPNNINALRDFRAQGRGLRVYGARCITSDTEWMYVNVRRLFIFLEASLDQGTQWAVFEPNDQILWGRLIQSVSNFLTTVWRQGGLMGATADQAFYVKCGNDTMSTDDIENGRLILEIGVAPVFPAEFVIIRIGQWLGGSSVQEV